MITYFHLRDFDVKQVRNGSILTSKESSIVRYFKNYYGIKGAYTKFQKFMNDFEFVSLEQAAEMINWEKVPIIKL